MDRWYMIILYLCFCSGSTALQAKWVRLDNSERIAPRRSGHVGFGVPGHKHFVFGGYVEEDSDGGQMKRYVTNDLWESETGHSWKLAKERGTIRPGPRLVAAAAVIRNKAYLFGGWDPETQGTGGQILDSVNVLDLETLEWKTIKETLPDGPASRHVAVAIQDKIVIHNHRCVNHIWIFDPKAESFVCQPTTGKSPSARGLHAAARVGDDKVVLFGGAAQEGTMSNEAFLLDTNTWEWTLFSANDDKPHPSPRAAPCLVPYSNQCVILYGGAQATETGLRPRGDVWALHLPSGEWELLIDDEKDDDGTTRPPPRNAATMIDMNENDDGHKTYGLIGGWHPFEKTFDDSFALLVGDELN
jgi:hypothetical protein